MVILKQCQKTFSTFKVYLAAITAYHIGIGGKQWYSIVWCVVLGRVHILKYPYQDLWLHCGIFLLFLTLSCVIPLNPWIRWSCNCLIASVKWDVELHAPSVHQPCNPFSTTDTKVSLWPHPVFTSKVVGSSSLIDLAVFIPCLLPWISTSFCAFHVHSRIYVDRNQFFQKSDQPLVSRAKPHVGKLVLKQHLSHWIVGAIALAYTSIGLQPPACWCAHSMRVWCHCGLYLCGFYQRCVCSSMLGFTPHPCKV